jgi:hypothetical protein
MKGLINGFLTKQKQRSLKILKALCPQQFFKIE